MIEERGGWFVVNVKDASWMQHAQFGRACSFEREDRFPQTGVRIHVLEPGRPNCRYHRESAQEDFLVLAGTCRLLVNGETRELQAWDYVHCPPGVTHVFVGTGEAPCTVLMIGHRSADQELFYPQSELARPYNAEAPAPTPDPKVAYSDVERMQPIPTPDWPIET